MALIRRLTGFFDAAGHPDGEHSLLVCGHVAEKTRWDRFERQWKQTLVAAGMTTPFHMSEFMACKGAFEGWRERVEDRAALAGMLVSIIRKNVHKAFSETILLKDWKAVNEVYQLRESHCTPYALAAFYVMDRTIRWWGKKHPKAYMTEFVFEKGDKHTGDFMWVMDRIIQTDPVALGIARPRFEKKSLAPLQAADFAGWVMRRSQKVWLTSEPEASIPRKVVAELIELRSVPHLAGFLDEDKLLKFCRAHDVPKRGEQRQWAGVRRWG